MDSNASTRQSDHRVPDAAPHRGIASAIAIFLIRFYRFAISPHLAGCCRFEPTCSSYGLQAFQKYDFFIAFKLTAKRLMRCRPGGPHGYDPLP